MGEVLFLYNTASLEEKAHNFVLGECAGAVTVGGIYEALLKTGNEVIPLNLFTPRQLEEFLDGHHIDIAFVIAEGFLDKPHTLYDGSGAMMVREILGRRGVPYTHSCPETMRVLRNKDFTHTKLSSAGIRVPSFEVISPDQMNLAEQVSKLEEKMPYPLFVKPAGGGFSICIDKHSIVHNCRELIERIRMVRLMLNNQPVLIETYLPGREYTVCVLGNDERFVLPVIGFAPDTGVRSAADKIAFQGKASEVDLLGDMHPVTLSLTSIGAMAFEVLGAQDIIRLDVKEDAGGVCHIIDVNGTPSMAPTGSAARMAAAMGIQQHEMIALVLYQAMHRENCVIPQQLTDMVAEPLNKLRSLQGPKVA